MNVIWIVSDTFRKDHLGCYGNKTIKTPSLDEFAAKSVRFERHYAANFPTMPARADFYTGRFTGSFMRWEPMPRGQTTISKVLFEAGFHTAAVVDTPFYIRDNMNYDHRFRTFIEVPGQEYWMQGLGDDIRRSWRFESDRFAPRTFTKAMQWLENHYKENFFLYIDAWDPHEPWDAPNYYTELYWPDYDGEIVEPVYAHWQDVPGFTENKVKKAHATYCGEISMVDTWVGYFLRQVENMGLMDKTAIIFTTDHGFYFGEHNGLFGKLTRAVPSVAPYWVEAGTVLLSAGWTRSPLFEEAIACPLLIYVPGIQTSLYKGLTSAIDLMPTVLDILGQEIPVVVEGHSLLPAMKDTSVKGREFVISTHPFSNPGQIIRSVDGQERQTEGSDTTITTGEWSLLYYPEPGQSWLYHLPSDPKQEKNIIYEHPEIAKELHQILVKFMYDTNLSPELRDPRLELKL
jgi:arylsulfatase A-like enzyme